MRSDTVLCLVCLFALFLTRAEATTRSVRTTSVEVEEVVARSAPPNNGAGPLWCYGAPLIARSGEQLFASVMETGEGVPPLCNTRWRLFRRDKEGWARLSEAPAFREREPCPLALLAPDRLFLSVNPSTEPPGTQYGPCDPHLLTVDLSHPDRAPVLLRPRWSTPAARFTDHSYRGLGVDRGRGELLLLNIDATTSEQHWAFRDRSGGFRSGTIRFPIRACYPQVALRDRAAHVLAIGDIVEPRPEWREHKKERTGSAWDYVFRRLFYAWTPDITGSDFAAPVEIDNVEETGGHILNLDLWLDPRGVAHLLYLKTNTTPVLRDRFFPDTKIRTTLEHVQVREGRDAARATLLTGGEGFLGETPRYARFQATPDGRLYVLFAVTGKSAEGGALRENRLLRVLPRLEPTAARLDLAEPFTTFFTATERGGSPPSDLLDLFGVGSDPQTLRYARVRLPGS
jgi:hypothetical protein